MADSEKLQNADPKPENPLQFIRKRLSDPIDADEFRCMKQCLSKLNEDMGQMKADVTKISNIVSKLLPSHRMDINPSVDDSVQSMENNVGNDSHITMLDDSTLIFDQTATNDNDLNSTMHSVDEPQLNCSDTDAVNSSQDKDSTSDSAQGFTLEIVEVDVVNKSSLDLSMASQDEKASEEMQMYDSISDEGTMTSTPETTAITESVTDAHLTDTNVNIDELPIVFKEENSEEPLTFSQDFHGFNVSDMQESKMHLKSAETVDPNGLETLKEESVPEMVSDVSIDSHNAALSREPSKLDEPVYEVDTQANSASHGYDEPKAKLTEQEPFVAKISEDENANASHVEPFEVSIKPKAATESAALTPTEIISVSEIVEGILNKVEDNMDVDESENEVNTIAAAVDGSPNIETNEVGKTGNGYAKSVVVTVMPKDDPETKLFLSYS